MHRTLAAGMAALLTALPGQARATTPTSAPPLVVLFQTGAGDLPEAEIRQAIARELGRTVQSAPAPDLATVTIARDGRGEVTVRYQPPASELERKVAVPADATEIPLLVALVAKNLTSNEARDVMAELGAKKSGSEGALPAAATEPQRGLYVRLSFGIGYGAAAYSIRGVTKTGSTPARSEALKVGLTIADAGFHIAVGKMSASGLAIGGELSGSFAYLDQHGGLAGLTLSVATPAQLGVFVDDYLDARGPLHLQGGVGLAWMPFAYGITEPTVANPAAAGTARAGKVSPLFGATGYVGAGYDFGPPGMGHFGLFARTCFGYYADADASFVPLGFRIGVSGAWL
jgi:hypothetical protein